MLSFVVAEPVHVEPIDPPTANSPLSYRTVRWISVVGIAPRWVDLALLAVATGATVGVFCTFFGVLLADGWAFRLLWAGGCAICLALVATTAWWSNHFKHRRIDDDPDMQTTSADTGSAKTERTSENVV
ncbi:MAG: hypothetical protein AAGD32_12925 [Planctomycetota bacterium]